MLLFIDGFDHYSSATQKWTSTSGDTVPTPSSLAARFGTQGLRITFGNTPGFAVKTLPSSYSTLIVGVAFNVDSFRLHNTNVYLVALNEGGTNHLTLGLTATGLLEVMRNGTVLATGTTPISTGVWYYAEIKAVIHDSTGAVTVRLNGVNEITGTSLDTRNGGAGVIDTIHLRNPTSNIVWFDDLYVCDTSGSTNNDFLGDVRVEALFPNGNGNSSQLAGSDGNSTDNYLLVDETSPNGDTDYVESSTVGQKDTYAFGNLTSTTGSVYGVQILPYAQKTDAGTRSIASVARLSATEVDSADKTLSTTYTYLPDIRETKPGGGAWSITDVNNAEFGVKVTA